MKGTAGGVTKEYTYIGGDAYSAPVVAVTQGGVTTYYYLLRDYLGNITHQVNTSNTVVAEYSFDAWGRRRNPVNWSYDLTGQPELFADRGFTGHEHLKWFNLINMNGRLYDPAVGRFLNVDPYVQMPDYTQNFNRYSYCLNNPLKYTDPNGEVIFVPVLIAVGVGMLVDYGIQVTTNYLQRMPDDNWKDIWFEKIDFVDVAISGLASGITVGLGELYKVGKISKTFYNIGTNITKFGLPAVSAGINYKPEDGWEFSKAEDFLVEYTFNTLIKTHVATKYSDKTVDALFGDKPWKFGMYMEIIKQFADVPAAILFNSWGRSYTEDYRENPGFKNDNFPVMPPIVNPITLPKENKNNPGQRIMEALILYH